MTGERQPDLQAPDASSPSTPLDAAAVAGGALEGQPVADGIAGESSPGTEAESIAQPLVPATPPAAPVIDAGTPVADAETAPSRGRMAARGTLRFVQFAVGVGLFVFGIWIGVQAFQAGQKPSDTEAAQVVSNGVPTPPVVEGFAGALGSGGPDAVRSSISPDVFALLVGELQRDGIATIRKVDVLSTAVDGSRTATELIMTTTRTDGTTLWMNLIVHTEDGRISTLR
jgi:hypothetical protein